MVTIDVTSTYTKALPINSPMLALLLTFLLPTASVDYVAHYGTAYQEALQWVEEREQKVSLQAASYGLEAAPLMAVVFPELLRYVEWQDLLETEALGLAYVEGGCAWADFSIGAFQMKPSFAEALEVSLLEWPEGQRTFGHLLPDPMLAISQQRQARLDRLSTVVGQVDYLCCFYAFMQQRLGFLLVTPTPAQKVAVLATAYNSGFWKSWPALLQASEQQFFPYGTRYPQEGQHAYGAIAASYYQQLPPTSSTWTPFFWPFL